MAFALRAQTCFSFRLENSVSGSYPTGYVRPGYYTKMNHNLWTLMTTAGRAKLKTAADQHCKLKPGVDFVLNEKEVNSIPYLYPFPTGKEMFTGTPLKNYKTFRHSWILIRRQRPVVPCPERLPLPPRRMSANVGAKPLSIYLRPWTLSRKLSAAEVQFLGNFEFVNANGKVGRNS